MYSLFSHFTYIFSSLSFCVFRFFSLILLPRIRDDIQEYKRLNFHLMMVIMIRGMICDDDENNAIVIIR